MSRAATLQGATRSPGSSVPLASARTRSPTPPAHDALSVILCTAGYDHSIRFWEAWSGVCARTVQHPDSQVNRLAISPDKRWLAAAAMCQVRLYDCTLGQGMGQVGHNGGGGNPVSRAGGA
jgi:G protein beta subunit-like protein